MIIVDTNVISEPVKGSPSAEVIAWLDQHSPEELFTTAITEAELLYGIALLPEGTRKRRLQAKAGRLFVELFQDRILPFDSQAAHAYAEISARRRTIGRPLAQADAQICAIALVHKATLATRDIADFKDCGVAIVNPWDSY